MNTRGHAFAAGGFDRAAALRDDAAALDRLWPQATVLCIDAAARSSVPADPTTWPRGDDLAAQRPAAAVFLGLHAGLPCFALQQPPAVSGAIDLRTAGASWPATAASLFATAAALLDWQRRHRHCGACGAPNTLGRGGWSMTCSACAQQTWPRIDPAVIVAVQRGEQLLLGRQAAWSAGRWSLLAGFVEPGETLAQAVVREVYEEALLPVTAVRPAGDQPWPFPSALMLGFYAEVLDPMAEPVAGDELEAARWFHRDEISEALSRPDADSAVGHGGDATPTALRLPSPLSISRSLIERWCAGLAPSG